MASTRYRLISAASTNLQQVKFDGANLVGGHIINTNAAIRYVKLYDATDQPTVGTTVPAVTLQIPASSSISPQWPGAVHFDKTMWIATTTGVADSDATAVGAGDLVIQLFVE